MENFLSTVLEYWPVVLGVLGALLVAAKIIAKKTKTTKDDEIVAKIEDVVETIENLTTGENK
jgi:hypothetical protein